MTFTGTGVLTGKGVMENIGQMTIQHNVSFNIYDITLPATMTGDAPTISSKSAGQTFTIPGQGNMTRTEIKYEYYGGSMHQTPTNIPLFGWSDGNGLYFPGDTYTMPNNDVTFEAIWETLYSPHIDSVSPTTLSIGDRLHIYGRTLATTNYVEFNDFIEADITTLIVHSDHHISIIVPQYAISGPIFLFTISGSSAFFFNGCEIV